ncbi:hypothetical protein JNO54_13640 [Janibacter sp. YIM B02568]|uniref:DUF6801 domain-containing protein n=1 Tax=Janibacter endophyticus TaxID=2806261 RepID=UPI00194F3E96|nr:DUF6801 domain-containing protein [Janibacter endophyticus]MBM6547175.1 hypothetical protein [Janibacter endophyticus]
MPILGAQDFTVSLDTDAPESVTPGADVTAAVTGSVTLNERTINGMVGLLGWAEAEGTTVSDLTNLTTPRTPVSATQATLPLTGGSVTLTGLAAGEHTIEAPDAFTSTFSGIKADGSAAGEFEIPCEYRSGTQVIDTITAEEAPVEDEPTEASPPSPSPPSPSPPRTTMTPPDLVTTSPVLSVRTSSRPTAGPSAPPRSSTAEPRSPAPPWPCSPPAVARVASTAEARHPDLTTGPDEEGVVPVGATPPSPSQGTLRDSGGHPLRPDEKGPRT